MIYSVHYGSFYSVHYSVHYRSLLGVHKHTCNSTVVSRSRSADTGERQLSPIHCRPRSPYSTLYRTPNCTVIIADRTVQWHSADTPTPGCRMQVATPATIIYLVKELEAHMMLERNGLISVLLKKRHCSLCAQHSFKKNYWFPFAGQKI